MKLLSDELKKYRNENNLSTRNMAKKAGVSPQFISMVERGVTFPQINELEKLAKAMEIPFEEVIKMTYLKTSKEGVFKTYLSQKEMKARK